MPLETERGYHAMLFAPGIDADMPISNKSRAFGVTPMDDGLRVAGTVEIAGLEAPPDEDRAKILAAARPADVSRADTAERRYWMGFRPSTPDSLPILGPSAGRARPDLRVRARAFRHDRRPAERPARPTSITGATPSIDMAPYAPTRLDGWDIGGLSRANGDFAGHSRDREFCPRLSLQW